MPGEPMTEAAVVTAARDGDPAALDMLVGAYLPLVYNIVGRALDVPAEVDDVVQDVMLGMVRDLRQLRDPAAFRSWLVAIAMREVRAHWRRRRAAPASAPLEATDVADPGADFVDLTIAALGLSDQRREVALATRWLDPDDKQVLAVWWLEAAGELTRDDLAEALEVSPAQAAVLVHRAKARLDTARSIVRALEAVPMCRGLSEACTGWDGEPAALWRKRVARHVRECPTCESLAFDLVPAEGLLVRLGLVPVPIAVQAAVAAQIRAGHAAAGSGGARSGRRPRQPQRPGQSGSGNAGNSVTRHWTALSGAGKTLVAGIAALAVATGVLGVRYASAHQDSTTAMQSPVSGTPQSAALLPTTSGPQTPVVASTSKPTPTATPTPSPSTSPVTNTAFPIRAAFYYPWYPENFQPPGSRYTPSAGHYSVDDPAQVDRQIKDMQYGGLQAGIISWWGQGKREDKRTPLLMKEAAKLGFSWSAYYENEAYGDPSVSQITNDLVYLRRYSSQKQWMHVDGKPVIFVYADGKDGCGMATRWAQANKTAHYYVVLKVFGGYRGCANQPQGWHQYASGLDVQQGYSAIASPGFWRYDQDPTVPRDPATFRQEVTTVAESKAPFQLIISYNEWGEGTAVESATAWGSASGHGVYVDILHQVFWAHPR